jgi:hypothetical protein
MNVVVPVGAAVVRRQHKLVAAFRAAGATSRDRATTTAALAVDEGLAFRLLRGHGVLREAGENRFYLDEPAWEAHRARRRRIAFTMLGTVLLVALALLLWALTR